jgi:hypothetical protein
MSFDVCLQGKRLNFGSSTDATYKNSRISKTETLSHTTVNISNAGPNQDAMPVKKKECKSLSENFVGTASLNLYYWKSLLIILSAFILFYTQFLSISSVALPNTLIFNFVLFFAIFFFPNDCHVRDYIHTALCVSTALTGTLFDTEHISIPVTLVMFIQCFNTLYVHRVHISTAEYILFVLALFTSTSCFIVSYTLISIAYAAFLEFTGLSILFCVLAYVTRGTN